MNPKKLLNPMNPKKLLMLICLFSGIWLGGTPAKAQTQELRLPDSPQTQTIEQERDWSEVVINSQDLPPEFQGMPAEDLAELKQELRKEDFSVETVFAFMEFDNFELLFGVTTPLENQQEQNDFEAILAEPEVLRELVTDGMGAAQILEQNPLEELENIGEAVAGVTLKLNLEGVPANLDIVAFRRDVIGAFVFLLYLDGQTPRMPIANLARTLDDRAQGILATPN